MAFTEQEELYEKNDLNNSFNSNIYSPNFPDFNISKISKTKFAEHYHLFCKKCNNIPEIRFIKTNKIKYICKCNESPRELFIKDIYDYLFYSEEIDVDVLGLKCIFHKEKFVYYCKVCKKNICNKCIENCIEHENEIKSLTLDRNTIYKIKYIIEKISSVKINPYNDEYKYSNTNSSFFDEINTLKTFINKSVNNSESDNINNDIYDNESDNESDKYIGMKEKNSIYKINKDDFINLMNDEKNKINFDTNDEEYFSLNLFSIIVYDYQNYPNYNLIETTSNVEKCVSL